MSNTQHVPLPRIGLEQLEKLLLDPNVPEDQIRPYVRLSETASTAFRPVVEVNPETVVAGQAESALALSSLNGIARWRREQKYRRKIGSWTGLRVVSEGDSWFQYPFLLNDVIDCLSDEYAILSLDAAGDLLSDMIGQDELSAAIVAEKPHVVLLSAGGNDLLGDGRLRSYLGAYKPRLAAKNYLKPEFETFLASILQLYKQVFDLAVAQRVDTVICHSYGRAIPNGGRWLGRPMEALGITNARLQRQIVTIIVDRFHDGLVTLAESYGGRVIVADCRKHVADDQWHDELHPNDQGFANVADRIRQLIKTSVQTSESPAEARSVQVPARATSFVRTLEGLVGYDDEALYREVARRAHLLTVDPGVAGSFSAPVLSSSAKVSAEGVSETIIDLGRRIVERLHRELFTLACGTSQLDTENRTKLREAVGLDDVAMSAAIASALVAGLGVAPVVAPVVAALIVRHAIRPTWDETCSLWSSQFGPAEAGVTPSREISSTENIADQIIFVGQETPVATIIIDAGHGGSSDLPCSAANHARGPRRGLLEKNLTLDVALRVKAELTRRGHNPILTRETDVNVGGRNRALKARDNNADVLVSIHFNASEKHNAQGTETFVHRSHSNTGKSAELCRAVQAHVSRATGLNDRNRIYPPHYIQKAGWCVINPASHASKTAAVLTEISFMDRADEEERLSRDSYKQEIAISIAEGIESYLNGGTEFTAEFVVDDEYEDAVSQTAAEAGITVAEMFDYGVPKQATATTAAPELTETFAKVDRGHTLAPMTEAEIPSLEEAGRSSVLDAMARSLTESNPLENDAAEFSAVAIGDAPDFEAVLGETFAARSMVEAMFSNVEVSEFDFAAFEDFIRGLGVQNFQPIEFLYLGGSNSSGKCAALNSLPAKSLWRNIGNTALMLDRIRAELGAPIKILSAYRNKPYNTCISGAGGSHHMRFNAIDWRCSTGTPAQWRQVARQVRASDARFRGGIGYYPSSNFIHIDTRGSIANW